MAFGVFPIVGTNGLTIAMDTGFQSIGPFNRAFKAATNLTPTEFRRLAMAGNAAPVKRSIEDRPVELRNRPAGLQESARSNRKHSTD
jgi:AraC-like DNA-binding protein